MDACDQGVQEDLDVYNEAGNMYIELAYDYALALPISQQLLIALAKHSKTTEADVLGIIAVHENSTESSDNYVVAKGQTLPTDLTKILNKYVTATPVIIPAGLGTTLINNGATVIEDLITIAGVTTTQAHLTTLTTKNDGVDLDNAIAGNANTKVEDLTIIFNRNKGGNFNAEVQADIASNPNASVTTRNTIGDTLYNKLSTNAEPVTILRLYKNAIGKFTPSRQDSLIPSVLQLDEYDVAANMSPESRQAIGRKILGR